MSKRMKTLSNVEKKIVANELLKNAEQKRTSSLLLMENDDIASAIHLQILSMEEDIKALILLIDFHGFKSISDIKNINSIFKNHRLRFITGFILCSLSFFKEDIQNLEALFRNKRLMKIVLIRKKILLKYILRQKILRANQIKEELKLFSQMEQIRQKSNYVDFNNKVILPSDLDKEDFYIVQKRVLIINNIILFIDEKLTLNKFQPEDLKIINSSKIFDLFNKVSLWAKDNEVEKLSKFVYDIEDYIDFISDEEFIREMM